MVFNRAYDIPPSQEGIATELRLRAGPPPQDVYMARCFGALMSMLRATGDSRSVPQVLDALYEMHVSGQLYSDDGK